MRETGYRDHVTSPRLEARKDEKIEKKAISLQLPGRGEITQGCQPHGSVATRLDPALPTDE